MCHLTSRLSAGNSPDSPLSDGTPACRRDSSYSRDFCAGFSPAAGSAEATIWARSPDEDPACERHSRGHDRDQPLFGLGPLPRVDSSTRPYWSRPAARETSRPRRGVPMPREEPGVDASRGSGARGPVPSARCRASSTGAATSVDPSVRPLGFPVRWGRHHVAPSAGRASATTLSAIYTLALWRPPPVGESASVGLTHALSAAAAFDECARNGAARDGMIAPRHAARPGREPTRFNRKLHGVCHRRGVGRGSDRRVHQDTVGA